jgi:hypothetical protein
MRGRRNRRPRSGEAATARRTRKISLALTFALALGVPSAVASVTDIPVRVTPARDVHPVAGAGFLAWVQNTRAHPDLFNVYVKPDGGSQFRVNLPGTEGSLGGIDGTTLAYQQFRSGSDIKFFNLKTHARSNPPRGVNTKHWEYWPAFQRPWLLFARQNIVTGARSIILFNLQTHASRVLDVVGGNKYVQPGQLNGGDAVWVHWVPPGRSRVEIYDVANHKLTRVPNVRGYDWSPSVTENGTVYFERSGLRCGSNARIVRYPLGGPLATVLSLPKGIDLSSTYVFPLDDGSIQVFHDRIRCSNVKFGDDIYRFVDDYTVTLSVAIVGSGTVTSAPPGISCTSACSHEFEPNTTVTLTATPGLGSTFVGWSDASCPGTDPCTLMPTSDTSITATFNP